jgi:hypothetical protein
MICILLDRQLLFFEMAFVEIRIRTNCLRECTEQCHYNHIEIALLSDWHAASDSSSSRMANLTSTLSATVALYFDSSQAECSPSTVAESIQTT